MGITFLNVRIINPENKKKKKYCKFLIDSGATYSVVPAKVLEKLGIKPVRTEKISLANGEIIKKLVGNAYFCYKKIVAASPVIFGEEKIFLLGMTTIESLGMVFDPINRDLKPLPMVLM